MTTLNITNVYYMIINCNEKLLELDSPKIMAILNVTPDSFFDGSQYQKIDELTNHIDKCIEEGADIIDVGGMSSRPGAEITSVEEEWNRVEPALEYLASSHSNQIVSVDTVHADIARRAIEMGVGIINDISGGQHDSQMLTTVGQSRASYVMMHMRGTPETMQQKTDYESTVSMELLQYFKQRISDAEQAGIFDVILDPGFGFSKTLEQNYEVLNHLGVLRIFDKPILAGISRKSMIYKVIGGGPQKALNGTTALHIIALQQGAKILRVHDVKEAKEVLKLAEYLNMEKN